MKVVEDLDLSEIARHSSLGNPDDLLFWSPMFKKNVVSWPHPTLGIIGQGILLWRYWNLVIWYCEFDICWRV